MPTNYPLSIALTNLIRNVVVNDALPAVNQSLALYLAQDTGIPTLTIAANQVVEGTVPVPGQVTLDVEIIQSDLSKCASDIYIERFTTQITLKVPSVLNNRPEDFLLVGNVFHDELRQALSSLDPYNMVPVNPSGNRSLPLGCSFQSCYLSKMIHPPRAVTAANRITESYNWRFYHNAEITFPLSR